MRIICKECGCTNWTDDPLYDEVCAGCGASLAPAPTYLKSLRTTEFSHTSSDRYSRSDKEKLNVKAAC